MSTEIQISTTDFVDFILKSGTPKLTKVKQIKERSEYHPSKDFYKPIREAIIEFHRNGIVSKIELEKIINTVIGRVNEKKIQAYKKIFMGYCRFLGKRDIEWFSPPRSLYQDDDLCVTVNPELGLIINGSKTIVKLYFKDTPITKNQADLILNLMGNALADKVSIDTEICLLDTKRGKIFRSSKMRPNIEPLLKGEAKNFLTIWGSLN